MEDLSTQHHQSEMSEQSIVLVGIVKDERDIIERMLASVDSIIDAWVIIDTGSTDGTREYLADRGDGILDQAEWVDFSHNRNQALALARQSVVVDYFLLLDADLSLEVLNPSGKLLADSYLLEHIGDDGGRYWAPRLVKADLDWRFKGRTHEYLTLDGAFTEQKLRSWRIRDHADGSSRSSKAQRDLGLLLKDWEDEDVDKGRVAGYLADTYASMRSPQNQKVWLEKRLEIGGGDAELFYYRFQLASLLNDPQEMAKLWLKSPDRIEPPAWLGQYYLARQDFFRAYHFARIATETPYPEDIMFINSNAYTYDALFMYSVAAWNLGKGSEAVAAGRELLSRNLPEDVRKLAEANLAEFLDAND